MLHSTEKKKLNMNINKKQDSSLHLYLRFSCMIVEYIALCFIIDSPSLFLYYPHSKLPIVAP